MSDVQFVIEADSEDITDHVVKLRNAGFLIQEIGHHNLITFSHTSHIMIIVGILKLEITFCPEVDGARSNLPPTMIIHDIPYIPYH